MEQGYIWMEDEQEMDIRDMLAWILLRWKIILCAMLVGFVLLGLYGYKKARSKALEDTVVTMDQVDALRGAFSEAEALEVENTYSQYQIYQNYIKNLGEFSHIFRDTKQNGGEILMLKYYLVSRLKYGSSFYTEMALSQDDYEKMNQIAYPEDTDGTKTDEKRMSPLHFFSDRDIYTDVYVTGGEKEPLSSDAILITAFITADTEEQCEDIRRIVDAAFEKETQLLKDTDSSLSCRCVDAKFSSDQQNFYDNVEKTTVDNLNIANNALSLLRNNIIEKFTDEQASYFEALKSVSPDVQESGDAEASTSSAVTDGGEGLAKPSFSRKTVIKYAIVGAMGGFIIGACLLLVLYIADDRMKTDKEMYGYGMNILDTLYFGSDGPIWKLARKIRGISPTPIEFHKDMLAGDIALMMAKARVRNLYFVITSEEILDLETSQQILEKMGDTGHDIIIGNPLNSTEGLRMFTEANGVVIFAHAKKSKRDTIKKVRQLCRRYDKTISGAIVIEEC